MPDAAWRMFNHKCYIQMYKQKSHLTATVIMLLILTKYSPLFLKTASTLTFAAQNVARSVLAAQIAGLLLYMLISLLWTETLNIFTGEKPDQRFLKRAKQFRVMNISWHRQLVFLFAPKNKEGIVSPLNGMCLAVCSRMLTAWINTGGRS